MKVVGVQRNVHHKVTILVLLAILFFVFVPTKFETYEETDTINTVEAVQELQPKTIIEEIPVEIPANTPHEIITVTKPLTDISEREHNDKTYASQEFVLTLADKYTGCVEYNYTFFEEERAVNKEKRLLCLNASNTEIISLEELFVGDIEDYAFNISVVPPVTNTTETIEVIEERNVTKYENITTYENVTKIVSNNVTKRVNWVFGFRWWFLE